MYEYIVNPVSGRKVSVFNKLGQSIIKNYLNQSGGFIRGDIRMPGCDAYVSTHPLQEGGGKCKKFRKTIKPKCNKQSGCQWVTKKGCLEDDVRNSSNNAPSTPKPTKATPKKTTSTTRIGFSLGSPCTSDADCEPELSRYGDDNFYNETICSERTKKCTRWMDYDGQEEGKRRRALAPVQRPTVTRTGRAYRHNAEEEDVAQFNCEFEDNRGKECPFEGTYSQVEEHEKSCSYNPEIQVEETKRATAPKKATSKPTVVATSGPSFVKKVTTKGKGTTQRLSAGEYYRRHGKDDSIGNICDIRQDGDYMCMLKRKNGTPYWAKKSKSGKGQEKCKGTPWESNCKETNFA